MVLDPGQSSMVVSLYCDYSSYDRLIPYLPLCQTHPEPRIPQNPLCTPKSNYKQNSLITNN